MNGLILRKGTWHIVRRVPSRFHTVEPRRVVSQSLKTDSYQEAQRKSTAVWAQLLSGWEARLDGNSDDAEKRFKAAQLICDRAYHRLLPLQDVLTLPFEEIVSRIEAIPDVIDKPANFEAEALLGLVEPPKMRVSALPAYIEELSTYENRFKSPEQMRLWRNPKKRAVANFIEAVGCDMPVTDIGKSEARKHRALWLKRINDGLASIETANKDFSIISSMIKRYYEEIGADDIPRPYADLALKDRFQKKNRKYEVPVGWIEERLLAEGALDGLHEEARDVLLITLETGCRQSEIFNLPPNAIMLDAEIPHILIANEEPVREIKNPYSERKMPLVGLALAAAKRHPDGFPRYRGKSSYGSDINRYLKMQGLLPDGITAGGLRHSWESRMKNAGYHSDDRGEMLEHSVQSIRNREQYGDAMSLARKADIAKSIAFPVPCYLA